MDKRLIVKVCEASARKRFMNCCFLLLLLFFN